ETTSGNWDGVLASLPNRRPGTAGCLHAPLLIGGRAMNQYDPTSTETTTVESSFREMTVEDMAAIDALYATDGGEVTKAAGGAPVPASSVSLPLVMQAVSGRYRGATGPFQLELRVDVDRVRPMKRVSGDFFQVSGATTTYVGSFIVNAPTITVTP